MPFSRLILSANPRKLWRFWGALGVILCVPVSVSLFSRSAFAGSLGRRRRSIIRAPPYSCPRRPRVYRDAHGAPIDPVYVRAAAPPCDPYARRAAWRPVCSLSVGARIRCQRDLAPQPMPDVGGGCVAASGGHRRPGRCDRLDTQPLPARTQRRCRPTAIARSLALPPEDQPETGPAKDLPPQFRRQIVSYNTIEPAGHHHHRYAEHLSVSRARQRQGHTLRHRRRPRGLYLDRHRAHQPHERMAGLVPAEGNDRASALSAALHGRRRHQSARRARACISAIRSTAFTAPTSRRPSAHSCRRAASG